MKRMVAGLIGAGGLVALAVVLYSQMQQPETAIAETPKAQAKAASANASAKTATPAEAAAPEKVVYTFEDDAKMGEFTNLWQQRESAIIRMSVLQSYWNQERDLLAKFNDKLTTDYKLDMAKNYFLDRTRRALIEREASAAPPAGQPTAQGGTATTAAAPSSTAPKP